MGCDIILFYSIRYVYYRFSLYRFKNSPGKLYFASVIFSVAISTKQNPLECRRLVTRGTKLFHDN